MGMIKNFLKKTDDRELQIKEAIQDEINTSKVLYDTSTNNYSVLRNVVENECKTIQNEVEFAYASVISNAIDEANALSMIIFSHIVKAAHDGIYDSTADWEQYETTIALRHIDNTNQVEECRLMLVFLAKELCDICKATENHHELDQLLKQALDMCDYLEIYSKYIEKSFPEELISTERKTIIANGECFRGYSLVLCRDMQDCLENINNTEKVKEMMDTIIKKVCMTGFLSYRCKTNSGWTKRINKMVDGKMATI